MDAHLVLREGNNYLINFKFCFYYYFILFSHSPFLAILFFRLHFWLHNYNMEILLSLFNNHLSKIFEKFSYRGAYSDFLQIFLIHTS